MTDRRAARASSRLKTPTPQPPSKPNTPQAASHATRKRTTRSASRDPELPAERQHAARRSARQASVTSLGSESEQDGAAQKSKAKRNAPKEAVVELPTVEEVDTQIDIQDAPSTPPRQDFPDAVPHRSPGAVSEMSGTTAISSFSMVEADLPAPSILIRKLPKLYETSEEFLNHLVPKNGRLNDDHQHIRDMQKPDSEFSAEYRILDEEGIVHLNHFRGEHQRYISRRAVHRALLGPNRDAEASQCGLDLIIYLANLLIFAKQAIHSDRNDKDTWDSLRELDNFFPTFFLSQLHSGSHSSASPNGESALLQETFELALDLRTQLAIIYLDRSANDDAEQFNPDESLDEVFFQTGTPGGGSLIRGWSIAALGGEDSALPQAFQGKVIDRINTIRDFFPTDEESVRRGEIADIDGLSANFPWDSLVLRLLGWVRSRNQELENAIRHQGGIKTIVTRVKTAMEQPHATSANAPRESPRKKRASFARNRRRSGKFNPNAEVNTAVVDMLIAKENEHDDRLPPTTHQSPPKSQSQEEVTGALDEDEDWQPPIDHERELAIEDPAEQPEEPEEVSTADPKRKPAEEVEEEPIEEIEEATEDMAGPSRPPQSTAETLKLLKQGRERGKENRGTSLFDRQPNARRVEFGDGFGDDSQPSPERSRKGKERQRSPPRKRARAVEESDDDEDDEFETISRTAKVLERRERAKRVRAEPTSSRAAPTSSQSGPTSSRTNPTSSNAPTSHQPPARDEDSDRQPATGQEESISENEAPEMTEEAPPMSTFASQRELARANNPPRPSNRQRKQREEWTPRAEEALIEYMAQFPRAYAQILKHDEQAYNLLQNRTQVNLKDKARNMAIVMIKSGAGLRPGFEGVVSYDSKHGRALIEDGYQW